MTNSTVKVIDLVTLNNGSDERTAGVIGVTTTGTPTKRKSSGNNILGMVPNSKQTRISSLRYSTRTLDTLR